MHTHPTTSGSTFDLFVQMWGPDILLITVLLAALYLAAIGPLRKHFADSAPVSTARKVAFLSGLLMFYVAVGSPVSYYGHHYLFSVHMIQQCLLFIFMVPLLLLGLPAWLVQPLFNRKILGKILTFLTRPVLAIFGFNVLFSLYHIPMIFDTFHAYPFWNNVFHVILTLAAAQMWWPMLTPIASQQRLSELRKMAYIFFNGWLLTPACALIIFAGQPLFQTYISAPVLFPAITPLEDQVMGGVSMKLLQEVSYGFILAYLFFNWYRKERHVDSTNILPNQKLQVVPTPLGDSNGNA